MSVIDRTEDWLNLFWLLPEPLANKFSTTFRSEYEPATSILVGFTFSDGTLECAIISKFDAQMAVAEDIMREDRDILRKLAK